jgi:hypothetical protein
MMMEWVIQEAEALALPCFDLVPVSRGEQPVAYWGGRRGDRPNKSTGAIRSSKHILSVDLILWDALSLKGPYPFALELQELRDGGERAVTVPVRSARVDDVTFPGAVPLKSVRSVSLPPLEAVLLYGGPAVDAWLKERGLRRWQYADLTTKDTEGYESYFYERCPLMSASPPFARVGGWHIHWSDDDFYIPREMRLMLWTFQDSEPWYEVFLTGMRNYVVKARIT